MFVLGALGFVVSNLFFSGCNAPINELKVESLLHYVNPFIGTAENGHTFPGATVPFGLVQLSPQTRNRDWAYCSGYQYRDSLLYGFGHSYLNGTGVGDLGDVLILPYQSMLKDSGNVAYQVMDKSEEKASPGYYSVKLDGGAIQAEMTASPHVGFHKYKFVKGGECHLLINIDNLIRSFNQYLEDREIQDAAFVEVSPNEITGYILARNWVKRQVYFVIQLDHEADVKTVGERILDLSFDHKPNCFLLSCILLPKVFIYKVK